MTEQGDAAFNLLERGEER